MTPLTVGSLFSGILAICTQREHRIFQLQLEEIAIRLYKKGLVKFDDAKLEYRLLEGIL